MAVTLTVEDGTGKADANTYASVAEADAYFGARPRSSAWAAIAEDAKARLLIHATRILDIAVKWAGERFSETQALEFPRYPEELEDLELPTRIKEATCELALALNARDLTGESNLGGLSEIEVGPIKLRSNNPAGRQDTIPPFVRDMIAPWGTPRGQSITARLERR